MIARLLRGALVGLLVAGCAPPPVASPDVAPGPPQDAPCATKDACLEAGARAEGAQDLARAQKLYRRACHKGSGRGCHSAALLLEGDANAGKRYALFREACVLGYDGATCFTTAERLREANPREALAFYRRGCAAGSVKACARGSVDALGVGDDAAALEMATRGCDDTRADTCDALGVLHAQGRGVPRDEARALALFHKGCAAHDPSACDHEKKLGAATPPRSGDGFEVPNANLRMGSLTVDGFTMDSVVCRAENAGLAVLLLGPALGSRIAAKQAPLRACSPKGGEARVRFAMAGGRITSVEAKAATPAVEKCVTRALERAPAPAKGMCAMTLHLGKKK
jgi:hypothetical protein